MIHINRNCVSWEDATSSLDSTRTSSRAPVVLLQGEILSLIFPPFLPPQKIISSPTPRIQISTSACSTTFLHNPSRSGGESVINILMVRSGFLILPTVRTTLLFFQMGRAG